MAHTRRFGFLLILQWIATLTSGQSLQNVSIDDQDPSITYFPQASWRLAEVGQWDAGPGKAHMVTTNPNAYATFTFTGVALYYWSAHWPYAVSTSVSVDGKVTIVDQRDYGTPFTGSYFATQTSRPVVGFEGLDNKEHVVRVFVGDTPEPVAVVDMFIYTISAPGPLISSSLSMRPSTTLDPENPGTPSESATSLPASQGTAGLSTAVQIGIALAVICGVLFVLIVVLIWRWLKRKGQESESTSPFGAYHNAPAPGLAAPPMAQQFSGSSSISPYPDYSGPLQTGNIGPAYYGSSNYPSYPQAPPTPAYSQASDPRSSHHDGSDYYNPNPRYR